MAEVTKTQREEAVAVYENVDFGDMGTPQPRIDYAELGTVVAECSVPLVRRIAQAIADAEQRGLELGRREGGWKKNERYEPVTLQQKFGYLVEECGEVMAATGKTIRWGLQSTNPELPPEQQETNCAWLLRELDDLETAIGYVRGELLPSPPSADKSLPQLAKEEP